jgi:LCP family protein required for cell wall assembly
MTLDGARTDSIVLVSYYWQEKKVVTLNIPRDMYVYDGYENAKMGEVYAYAQQRNSKDTTYASSYVAMVIAKEYGISIDYWYKLNMQGEVDLINAIGGVDVTVPNAFTDYEYPTWNYSGYIRPAPTFAAGLQHMNGSTALIYSRSRHSLDNSEGSDFARSNRQALVIQAVMTKLKSMGVVGNLPEISKYSSILGQNVDTSMSTDEMVSFAKTLKTLNPATDFVHGNWATGNGFLCDTTSSYGAYIILYGNAGTCGVQAGVSETSTAKDLAVYYVKNLLTSAVMTPEQFVTAASAALHPATTTTVSP